LKLLINKILPELHLVGLLYNINVYSSEILNKQLVDTDVSTQGSDILNMFKVKELKSKSLFRKNGRSYLNSAFIAAVQHEGKIT